MLNASTTRNAAGVNPQQTETTIKKITFNGKPAAELVRVERLNYNGTTNKFLSLRTTKKTSKGVQWETISSNQAEKISGLFTRKLSELKQKAANFKASGNTFFLTD